MIINDNVSMILDIDQEVLKRINHNSKNLENIKNQILEQLYLLRLPSEHQYKSEVVTSIPTAANVTKLSVMFVHIKNSIPYPMWLEVYVSADQVIRYNSDSRAFMMKYGGRRVEDFDNINLGGEVIDEITIEARSRLERYMNTNNINEDFIFVSESHTAKKAL